MKYILGVSLFHDSSVCLLKNGQLIEFIKGIFNEIKDHVVPFRALTFLAAKYGLSNDNVDRIAFMKSH